MLSGGDSFVRRARWNGDDLSGPHGVVVESVRLCKQVYQLSSRHALHGVLRGDSPQRVARMDLQPLREGWRLDARTTGHQETGNKQDSDEDECRDLKHLWGWHAPVGSAVRWNR